jgi:CHAT domain-containing protein
MSRIIFVCIFGLCSTIINCQPSINEDDLDTEILRLYDIGYQYLLEAKFDSAEYFLSSALKLQEQYLGPYNSNTIASYINLAVVYRTLYDSQKSIDYLSIAEKRLLATDPNSEYLTVIYNNKGNIYLDQFDYAEAKRYYEYSISMLRRKGETNNNNYRMLLYNYIRSLSVLGQIDEVKDNYIIELNKHKDQIINRDQEKYDALDIRTMINLASALELLGEYETAIEVLDFALKINSSFESRNTHLESNIVYEKGIANLLMGDYEEALKLFKWIIAKSIKTNEIGVNRILFTHYRIGEAYYLSGYFESAFNWIDHAISDNLKNIELIQDTSNVRSVLTASFEFILLYHLKAKSAKALYDESGELDYLITSFETYERLINVLLSSRLNMKNEESVFNQADAKIQVMYEAVGIAVEAYHKTDNISYLEKAFNFNEAFKASSLNSEINKIEAIQFAGLPSEIKFLEDSLSRKISSYEQRIYEEQMKSEKDNYKLTDLESKLFNLKDDYNDLVEKIEVDFPQYFQLKYNSYFTSLETIKNRVHFTQALVEYVLTDTILYTFIVDNQQQKVLTQKIEPGFADACIRYYQLLQSQDFDKDVHKTYEEYTGLARKFYKVLVEPVRKVTKRKEIIFVPDGELMYLPFETFLTEDVDSEYMDYLHLPYLIHELSVGYSYSATLLFNNRVKPQPERKEVLAFAPAYENLQDLNEPLVWNRQSNPDFLVPLLGAREEVNNLSSLIPSRIFMDEEATEQNFKKNAEEYAVLHLAMHTIMNDEEPMYSRLAFTRSENDSTEDNDLFTYEIYNLDLNAEMVVLSACSSGYGKMQKGEGMMSMARGFMYAGCPTIVMTLWQVSDKSSAELMSHFYRYLKQGKSKNEALRHAKIDYIESSDKLKANPYFWSSFLVVGDSEPLYGKRPVFYWSLIVGGFILLSLLIIFRRKIRKLF